MTEKLRHTTVSPGVALVALNRPSVRNALDIDLVQALRGTVEALRTEPAIRAMVLTSTTPGVFCAGADLSVSNTERRHVSDELYALYEELLMAPIPIIAALDGAAVGGGAQLALTADVRIASATARFRFVGPGHGLSVGSWALPSTVGRRGLELVLSQRFVTGQEAYSLGLVDRVVDDPSTEASALGEHIRQLDADAVRRAKEQVVRDERLVDRLSAERTGNAAVFDGSVPGRS